MLCPPLFSEWTKAGEEKSSPLTEALTFSNTAVSRGWSGLKVAETSWKLLLHLVGKAELGFRLIISSMCLVIRSNKGHFV